MNPIYLDYNATTPVDPEILSAMMPYLTKVYGNPSSSHKYGTDARYAVEKAREQVAALLECHPDEIIFTSGGTESNNIAIQGAAFANRNRGNHIIISAVEHPAVTEVARYLQQHGFSISIAPVDSFGRVDPEVLESLIIPSTILISVMHSNNETGTIQPVNEIAEIAHRHQILFHSDAAQSVGKIPVSVSDQDIDLLSVAGHKLYAPKGVGALYIKRGIKLMKFSHGADHESNIRPGTENVAYIVALGKACELISNSIDRYVMSMKESRAKIAKGLKQHFPDLRINGHPDFCLPNTLNISFKSVAAKNIIAALDEVAVSAGAACHSVSGVSGTLDALNLPPEYSFGALRISTGRYTSVEEAEKAVGFIAKAVKHAMGEEYNTPDSVPMGAELNHSSGNLMFSHFNGDILTTVTPESSAIKQIAIADYRITQFDSGLGCGCKMKPRDLEYILKESHKLPESVLVGIETRDDAAVWKINESEAIVQTVDFFTPMIDDPYAFGAIAAANSLSDIYAMGAKPLFVLNLVAFPVDKLSLDVLKEIIRGATDKATEAGIPVLGGHSIEDNGIKFGMVVTGRSTPDKIIKNSEAKVGDFLLLTKPLGTGILTKALSKGLLQQNDQAMAQCIESMMTLNNKAAEVMINYPVNACTDITGFGLSGHLHEMLHGSATDAEVYFNQITFFPEVDRLARVGMIPGSTANNLDESRKWMDCSLLSPAHQAMLCDSQTSGGLLIAVPENVLTDIQQEMSSQGIKADIIGRITSEGEGKITVMY